eukprot:COSAG06_NODE_19442_length_838_cov_1.185386_1_plen_106_part_10
MMSADEAEEELKRAVAAKQDEIECDRDNDRLLEELVALHHQVVELRQRRRAVQEADTASTIHRAASGAREARAEAMCHVETGDRPQLPDCKPEREPQLQPEAAEGK